jgi:hypothetical protein
VVFGLSGEPSPCDLRSFDDATPVQLGSADDFSIAPDRTIVSIAGTPFEQAATGGDAIAIDLGLYPSYAYSLAPEGDALIYTIAIEPPVLRGAVRDASGAWLLDRTVPAATFAGTPSANIFGPRRMIVRVFPTDTAVQELEDVDGAWTPIGDPHELGGALAPNLVPNGLTMVWSDSDADGNPVVLAATRGSTDGWFGEPNPILHASARAPQLLGHDCKQLFTSEADQIARRER